MGQRVKVVRIFFMLFLLAIGARAFYIQVVTPDRILTLAHKKFDYNVKLSAYRGGIYDKSGQPLAISLDVKSIAANPRMVRNPSAAAAKISHALNLSTPSVRKKVSSSRYFTWIKRQVSPDEVAVVQALNIGGIGFYNEAKRFYPESESLANILGIVGIDGQGLEGLELMFDNILKGKPRQIEVRKDGMGRIIYARGLPPDEAKDGYTLYLTLDRRLQYIAYSELEATIRQHNAGSGFAIITNPETGEIYAMVSYPSFNPNLGMYKTMEGHRNRAVVDLFEPGSIMKPIWISWGIESGRMRPTQTVYCENGAYTYHRKTIHDHEKHGWLPVTEVIKYSSNIGMVKLFDPVKPDDMYSCMDLFGFTAQTGIEFPGEPGGFIRQPRRWTSVDKATISYGQGFAVTGMQLISAFNSMINGGMLMKPYLIDHITDATGRNIEFFRPTIIRKVVSPQTSDQILTILKTVALKGGTGEGASMSAFQVFGKTGTAQKIDPLTGTYSKKDYVSSFIGGIIDASGKPRLTMIISINEPQLNYYGSVVACPAFKNIMLKCTSIMDISPNITVASKGAEGEGI
jgi:cell division protein FtsI (penicillin-binding protein 3)